MNYVISKLITGRNESKINASTILKKEDVERIVQSENRLQLESVLSLSV